MRRVILASLALTSTTSLAVAQPGMLEPSSPATPQDTDAYRDPRHAMALSAGASALGLGAIYLGSRMREGGDTPIMMLGGLVALVGPSAGAWYVDGYRLTPGLGIRLGGAAIMSIAFGAVLDRSCIEGCQGPIRDEQSDTFIAIGAAVVVAGMVYDVVTAGSRAREHNARLAVTPVVSATPNGDALVGVATRF